MSQGHTPLSAPPTSPPQGGRSTAAVGFTSRRLLTLALSPLAGRGDEASALAADVLLPACGEKVAGRPDEGQRAMDQGGIATARQQLRGTAPHPTRSVGRGHPPLSATPTSPPQGGRLTAAVGASFDRNVGALVIKTGVSFVEIHKTNSPHQVIVGPPAARRSPLLRGRCPAGQRGVAPHGDRPHA